ncbi:amino acid adenylation domain-containing protein [Pseudomonas sp. BIGb0381]|uniref:non-ribosomal peptide synthetase n=1 Tax=Pseudomonas sp. BIGb0381 TaxID=2940608 RepID=UPI0021680301|nr:non-ribosomal peptide synthetase [Pseudomonas sp. BIGb0381]MCS4310434.1 amino acid adenylation domain-containing protein [Pseudomonas sp. BIGb0381]
MNATNQQAFVEIAQRLASLPADKKQLFRQRLAEKGIDSWRLPIVPAAGREGAAVPLAHAQLRFLSAEALSSRALYNLCSVLRFDGRLDLACLQQAMQQLVERHTILRTRYVADAQGRLQAHCEPWTAGLPAVEPLPREALADPQQWCADEYARQLAEPFDLSREVPWRWRAFSDAEQGSTWLFFTIHHVAYDAWSAQQLTRELAEGYRALSLGAPAQLPPLDIQYADYAAWEHEWLTSDACGQQLDYWRSQLADAPGPLALPCDHPRPPANQRRHSGAVRVRELPADLSAQVDGAIREQGVTLYIFGLTAFACLLARYSGERDLCLGTSVAQRDRPELAPLIGPLLNTLVIRQRLEDDPDFRSALLRTRDSVAAAFDQQTLPYEKILEALDRPRSSPLFQAMFVQVELPESRTLSLPGVSVEVLDPPQRHARFDLTLRLLRCADQRLRCELEYSDELFEAATIEQLLDDLQAILQEASVNPGQRLSALRLASPGSELHGPALGASPEPLDRQVQQWAARTPQAPALCDTRQSLAYGDLANAVQALALRLAEQSVGPGQVVALCMPRSAEQVLAMLACWQRGATCLFLDPAQPVQRLQQLLESSAASLLLTLAEAPALNGAVARLQLSASDLAAPAPCQPVPSLSQPEQAAYLIYTSGSTGQPKGVLVSHANLAHYAAAVSQRLQASASSRWATLATVAADLGLTCVFAALHSGDSLILPEAALAFDPPGWADFLAQHPVDCLKIAPSHLRGLLALDDARRVLPRQLLILGGEGFDAALFARIRELAPELRVFNHYGPSETTVGVVCGEVTEAGQGAYLPLGQPLAGAELRIVDAAGQPVPRGVAGELLIGGPQVALGYLGQPQVTAVAFIDDAGRRFYRSGDRVRLDHHGRLAFLGRQDDQVKIRGFRVEPGEVSTWLSGQSLVREAAVLAREIQGRMQLVAYLAPRLTPDELSAIQAQARAQLPEPLQPAYWSSLDALPLTANGKLDRRALPEPETNVAVDEGGQAPQGVSEQLLARLWCQVLGCAAVTRQDDFFALGGDSILSLQLIGLAAREGLRLQPRDVLEQPTLAAMAASADCRAQPRLASILAAFRELLGQPQLGLDDDFFAAGGDSILSLQLIARLRQADLRLMPRQLLENPTPRQLAAALEPAPATRSERAEASPALASAVARLSHAQERLWFMQQLEPDTTAYNVTQLLVLQGELHVPRLRSACLSLIERHEALRCRFFEDNGQVRQRLVEAPEASFALHDLRASPADARETAIALAAQRVFDLAHGPLVAIDLFQFAEDDYRLLFNAHHIAVDGWSMGLLVQDLAALYEGRQPAPRTGLLQVIEAQRQALEGDVGQVLLDYWQQRLQGLSDEPLALSESPRPALQAYAGAREQFPLPGELTSAIAARAKQLGVTPFVLYFAAQQLLLWKHAGRRDFAIGLPVSGREAADSQALVGLFVNTLVYRVQLDELESLEHFLQRLGQRLADDRAHEQLPFERLLDVLEVERSLDRTPLFQAMFNYQVDHLGERNLQLPGVTVAPLALPQGAISAKFDLTFNLFSQGRGDEASSQLIVEYATALFDPARIQCLVDDYLGVLASLAHLDLQQPLLALPLPSVQRLHSAGEAAELDIEADFVTRFEVQAALHPERTAVFCRDRQLSYGQLQAQANQLAHWLLTQGVTAESTIAFCLPRDERLLVCLLGIQKAGAQYLPLDPSHPPARQAAIVQRARPHLLLCDLQDERFPATVRCQLWQDLALQAQPADAPALPRHLQQLAYTLYTSGSTGQPKGVQISRGNFANFLLAMERALPLDGVQRYLALTTVTFDISGLELCLPLVRGGSVVLADDEQRQDPLLLAQLIRERAVELIQATPATWAMLLQGDRQVLAGRVALAGGEALAAEMASELKQLVGCLINVYGPTETSVWSTQTSVEELHQPVVPIGRPLLNTRCHVLDEFLCEVPPGRAGELYIAGLGLARGYAGQPALSAERFIADPFGGAGGRLYRTGDVARWQADGQLYYLGRSDDQIKLRGFRIELGEIEAALLGHPGVAQAVVAVQGEHLAAFWVASLAGEPSADELREHLQARLPVYMLPTHLQALPALPLNSNGKVDRQQLPQLRNQQQAAAGSAQRPMSASEALLSEIWGQVLQLEQVPLDGHFFQLGGHSLMAAQVRSRLREQGFEVPLRWLFETPLLTELAARLDTQATAFDPAGLSIARVDQHIDQPLSPAQQRVWLMQQLQPSDSSFNMSSNVRLRGALDTQALQRALQRVIRRHAILRTTYHQQQGEARQRIQADSALTLQLATLSQAQWAQAEHEMAARPFDLSVEAPLRAVLYRLGEQEHVLQLVLHHIASDGWSGSVLIGELVEGYEAYSQGRLPVERELAIQYVDYAAWQVSAALRARQRQGQQFWQRTLAGVPSQVPLPFDFPRGERDSAGGAALDFQLPAATLARLEALQRDSGLSLFMLLLTVYAAVLQRETQGRDLVIGTDVANREHPATEALIGFFVNLLALRIRLQPELSFREQAALVRDVCLDAFAWQDTPFEQVVECLDLPRGANQHPLLQTLFVLDNTPRQPRRLGNLEVTPVSREQQHSKFDMALFATPDGDALSLRWVYRTSLFRPATIERLRDSFLALLDAALGAPDSPIDALPLPSKGAAAMSTTTDNPLQRKMSKLGKLRQNGPAAAATPIETRPLRAGSSFPLLVQLRERELAPAVWAESNREQVEGWLREHGGIIFRGFDLPTPADFEQFCQALCPELYGQYGDLPKKEGGNKIYKSTPYPKDRMIMFHNESAHQHRWPRRQWFYCETPATSGGATPIVDSREVYRELPAWLQVKLRRKQLMYVRNFSASLDVSWQHFFQTEERAEAERICHEGGIEFEWRGANELHTRQVCPAVILHPLTGDASFFNQIQLYHPAFLDADIREQFLKGRDSVMPRQVFYGDGSELEEAAIEAISAAYERCAVRFDWQRGDVVMLDNMLAAHARDPFEGERRIVVAMGDIYRRDQVAAAPATAEENALEMTS